MREREISGVEELKQFSRVFKNTLTPRDIGATVVALEGELGAGKTTFTQFLARELGISDRIPSPTYLILRKYPITGGKFKKLYHIDAYRFEDESELEVIGWKKFIIEPENLVVVEWADRIEEYIPDYAIWLTFRHAGDDKRIIEIKKDGKKG